MKKAVLGLFFLTMVTSCADVGLMIRVIFPQRIHKESLKNSPYAVTPIHKFKVSVAEGLLEERGKIISKVDSEFSEFSGCMNLEDGGKRVRRYLISAVEATFGCKYHRGSCNGEFDPGNGLIIVTYKGFNRKGILPLLKHEWAHAYGFLESDDSNLDEVTHCTNTE